MSTITDLTITDPTITTPRPTLDPAVAAAATQLVQASEVVADHARTEDLPGVARRLTKLSRQLQSASRLLNNGRGLDAPEVLVGVRYLTLRADAALELDVIDATISRSARLVVALHDWRGHTACVPVTTEH